jgi:ribonuclease BN (tRNA processing enzyme)
MQIKVLGAHNLESENTRFCSLLIDGVIAIDAGALTSSLSFAEQQEIKAVLLTHQHYDHIRDIPALAINYQEYGTTIDVYSIQPVYEVLTNHLLNNVIYPNFMERPAEKPALKFHVLEPGQTTSIAGYEVLPVKVAHAIPAVGYQITAADGKKVCYTADTGPGLTECWEKVSPDLLVVETTVSNEYESFALNTGHLTPNLLQKELEDFRQIEGYIPRVVVVHMSPIHEKTIEAEIATAARSLNADIQLGFEGMQLDL